MLRVIVALPFFVLACGDQVTTSPPTASDTPPPPASGPGVEPAPSPGAPPPSASPPEPRVLFPRTGIEPDELAVIVNDANPLSVEVAAYYIAKRKIPALNVVHVSIATTGNVLSAADFAPLKTQVDAALAGTKAQAMLLTWTKPFRVDNMAITSAFAIGYKAITGSTCTDPNSQFGNANPYLRNLDSTRPFTDLGFRPTMALPATTLDEAKSLVDRGVAADGTQPSGRAYLMKTSDRTRSARCIVNATFGYDNQCQRLIDVWDVAEIPAAIVEANAVKDKPDVLFYVQGLASVPDLATNTYPPGAIADHLTSFGGVIPTSGQMSAFEFLRAGATASYGTVVEPCAYVQKFPDPQVYIPRYFGGNTLVEAYWKSVDWPAEGIFIGEPLARPFGTGFTSRYAGGTLIVETTAMVPGKRYLIEAADADDGPFAPVLDELAIPKYRRTTFTIPDAGRAVYRFRAK